MASSEVKKNSRLKKYLPIELLLVLWFLSSTIHELTPHKIEEEKSCHAIIKENPNQELTSLVDATICDQLSNETFRGDVQCYVIEKHLLISNDYFYDYDEEEGYQKSTLNLTEYERNFCHILSELENRVLTKPSNEFNKFTVWLRIIVVLVSGYWGDKYGYLKLILLLPIIGQFLNMVIIAITFDLRVVPLPIGSGILEVLNSIFGGHELLLVGIYYYLTINSSKRDRTFRFAFIPFVNTKYIYSLVLRHEVFLNIIESSLLKRITFYSLPVIFYTLSILYIIYVIDGCNKASDINCEIDEPYTLISRKNCKLFNWDMFNFNSSNSYTSVLKKFRKNKHSSIICYLLLAYILMVCPVYSENYLLQHFLDSKNLIIHHAEIKLFEFLATVIFGALVMTTFFTKFINTPDAIIAIVSLGLTIISKPFLASALNNINIYNAFSLDFLGQAKYIATISYLSKVVCKAELKRTFALMTVCVIVLESFVPWLIEFSSFKGRFFPGMIFIFNEFFLVSSLFLYIIIYALSIRFGTKDDIAQSKAFHKLICCKAVINEHQTEEELKSLVSYGEDGNAGNYTEQDIQDALERVDSEISDENNSKNQSSDSGIGDFELAIVETHCNYNENNNRDACVLRNNSESVEL